MSYWDERFDTHEIHGELAQLDSLLNSIGSSDAIQAEQLEAFGRVRQFRDSLSHALSAISPLLVTEKQLDSILPPLRKLAATLREFADNNDPALLLTANNHVDELIPLLVNLRVPQSAEDVAELRDTVRSFRISAGQHAANLEREIHKLEARITALNTKLSDIDSEAKAQKGRVDSVIAEFQKQFSDAEERRRISVEESAKALQVKHEVLMSNAERQLLTTITDHKTRLGEIEKQLDRLTRDVEVNLEDLSSSTKDRLETLIESEMSKFEEVRDAHSKSSAEALEELDQRRSEAAKLIQLISDIAVTGDYSKTADRHERAANRLRWAALVFMTLMVAVASVTVWHGVTAFDWRLTILRMLTTLIFAIPAYYAARESEGHRRAANRSRRMQLELASIDPYLSSVSDAHREELKTKLAEKFFAQPEAELSATEKNIAARDLFDLLKVTLQNLTRSK
ncbi:MAG: hypothetical protein Kow0074_06690 [Candidatus Zixiibacteriota bacterium]